MLRHRFVLNLLDIALLYAFCYTEYQLVSSLMITYSTYKALKLKRKDTDFERKTCRLMEVFL